MSDICMCIERLWPYWLLHWRTQYYGLLTIIALYIRYLITFGCYLKAEWSIVYLWKGTTTKCLVHVFMGNPRKGRSECGSLRKGVCAVAWPGRSWEVGFLRKWGVFIGKNILKMNCCSDIPMNAIQLECSASYSFHHAWLQCSVYIVNSCT